MKSKGRETEYKRLHSQQLSFFLILPNISKLCFEDALFCFIESQERFLLLLKVMNLALDISLTRAMRTLFSCLLFFRLIADQAEKDFLALRLAPFNHPAV